MQSCKPWWIVKEVSDSVCEMLVLFEPEYGELEPTPSAPPARDLSRRDHG